ncbi:MAG TPA: SMP-30/gluconolactonase/LRE family protein [Sphingomicrobium sp.]|nr:SMP-30/gluconolactonase/LRE family protein [Sphingomicrobium sp.]
MTADIGPRCVADVGAVLGEGPVWVEAERALYWVDIKGWKIFRLDEGGAVTSWPTPLRVGSLAPRDSGGFIAGTEHGFAEIDLESGRFHVFANPEPARPGNRFNDGKTDRTGRFWAGTMDNEERAASGALYRLDPDRRWKLIDDGYRVTNGPAFDPSGTRMYHTDSARQIIYAFDLSSSGEVSHKRVFAEFGEDEGYPDGMTVDAEGHLWVAFWDGWSIRRLSTEGAVIETVKMPVQRPTSCAFGGPALDRLYVTSASIDLDEQALAMQPCAGGLFLLETGVRGMAPLPYAG